MKTGHSEILNQDWILNESGILTTDDNTSYTPEEMKLLKGVNHEVLRDVHKFKNAFNGEVIK